MNEEIEYAEMLEIPVSTVNVVHKKSAKSRKQKLAPIPPDLKDSVIAKVNDKLLQDQNPQALEENEGTLNFDGVPDRIDTVRLYSESEHAVKRRDLRLSPEDFGLENQEENSENDESTYAPNYDYRPETKAEKRTRIILTAEFAAACALCGAIFLTNVFMPGSAINTFFRALGEPKQTETVDARTYADFSLSPIVSELSDAEITVSPAGIVSFTDECHVYPVANGKITDVTQNTDGKYTVKISHSDSFSGVIGGLDTVYYAVGDEVKANIPLGFTGGETEVQVTMYQSGELLNCFELTEENCLAWTTQE